MKYLAAVVAFLVLMLPSFGTCPGLRIDPQPSSRNVRLIALIDGIPHKDVEVDFFDGFFPPGGPGATETKASLTLLTNNKGIATANRLAPGPYRVVARYGDKTEILYLKVSGNAPDENTLFELSLRSPGAPDRRSIMERVSDAEILSPSQRIQSFKILVTNDLLGTVVHETEITVWRQGASGQKPLIKAKSDAKGFFSSALDPGKYIGVFESADHRVLVLVFEIAPDGDARNLEVRIPGAEGMAC